MRKTKRRHGIREAWLIWAALTILWADALSSRAQAAATQTVLYSFKGPSRGADPSSGLIRDAAGNMYGTTSRGGATGNGVVYKVDPAGNQTVLYSFTGGADGGMPEGGVIGDGAGNLYGINWGGDGGLIYKLNPAGILTVLHRFSISEGLPAGGLIRDAAANLYGTTQGALDESGGTVYKLDPAGNHTVLYRFSGGADGGNPAAGVIRDSTGNLYGTTPYGGVISPNCVRGCGVVFKVEPAGHETVLYSFQGGSDGGEPFTALTADSGNLYGTTSIGATCGGCGVVFRLDAAGHLTVLYSLGYGHGMSGLFRDSAGNLYGTYQVDAYSMTGVVFRVTPTGQFTNLYTFPGSTLLNGAFPATGVLGDGAGNLYGTAYGGFAHAGPGASACATGCGVVFKLNAAGSQTVLYRFPVEPENPVGGLIRDASGNLYGTTITGGASDAGVVFRLASNGKVTVLHHFTGSDGAMPFGTLSSDSTGNLYGTAYQGGGADGFGTVFKINAAGVHSTLFSFGSGGSQGVYPVGGVVADAAGNVYGTTSGFLLRGPRCRVQGGFIGSRDVAAPILRFR